MLLFLARGRNSAYYLMTSLKAWLILILRTPNTRSVNYVLTLVLMLLVAGTAQGQITENNSRLSLPNSRLHRPYDAPIFITGHVGIGGGFKYSPGEINYGASFIFRPGSSANFFDFLQKLKSAMVLQLDYQQLTETTRMVSGDLILRRYLNDRGDKETEVLPFIGLGVGASDVTLTAAEGGGSSRYWSGVVEVGQEWFFRPNFVVVARGQYRLYSHGEAQVSTWSVSGAVGIPVPW